MPVYSSPNLTQTANGKDLYLRTDPSPPAPGQPPLDTINGNLQVNGAVSTTGNVSVGGTSQLVLGSGTSIFNQGGAQPNILLSAGGIASLSVSGPPTGGQASVNALVPLTGLSATFSSMPRFGFNSSTPAIPLVLAGVAQTGVSGFVATGNSIPNNNQWATIFSWDWATIGGGVFDNANLVNFIISGSASNPYGDTQLQSTSSGPQPLQLAISDQTTQFNNANDARSCASLSGPMEYTVQNGDGQNFAFPVYGFNISETPLVTVAPRASPTMFYRGTSGAAVVMNTAVTNLYLHAVKVI